MNVQFLLINLNENDDNFGYFKLQPGLIGGREITMAFNLHKNQ